MDTKLLYFQIIFDPEHLQNLSGRKIFLLGKDFILHRSNRRHETWTLVLAPAETLFVLQHVKTTGSDVSALNVNQSIQFHLYFTLQQPQLTRVLYNMGEK